MFRLVKEIFGAQVWQASILISTVILQITVARYVGATGSGTTSVIVAASSICIFLVELNLQSALVRALSVAGDLRRGELRKEAFYGRLFLALAASPVVALIVYLKTPYWVIFYGVILGVVAQELNPGWWLQGTGKVSGSFVISGCAALVGCAISIPVVYFYRRPGLECLVTSLSAIAIYGGYWYKVGIAPQRPRALWATLERYFHFAREHKGFLLGSAAFCLYLYPAKLLMASNRGMEEAGLYVFAMLPAGAYLAITTAAFNAYFPQFVRARSLGDREYKSVVRRTALLVLGFGVLAWVVTLGAQRPLLALVGDKFRLSVTLAPVLILSRAIGGLVFVVRGAFLARQRENLAFGVFFAVGVCALVANMIAIPRYGLIGATIVEGAQEITHLMLLLFLLMLTSKPPTQVTGG